MGFLHFVREYNRVDGGIWELDHPMPPGFFLKANKMVVG